MISPFGGLTVGWMRDPTVEGSILFSLARCSRKDMFNKKKARRICEARLKGGKFFEVDLEEGKVHQTINNWLMSNKSVVDRHPVPKTTHALLVKNG